MKFRFALAKEESAQKAIYFLARAKVHTKVIRKLAP
jgi:hypothetical protein